MKILKRRRTGKRSQTLIKGLSVIMLANIGLNYSGAAVVSAVEDQAHLQATSNLPVPDDRVARVWEDIPADDGTDSSSLEAQCTANYLGGKFWVTARHCLRDDQNVVGYLEQADGEYAGIENVYIQNSNADIALIKVAPGISATPFELPETPLGQGEKATLVGYAHVHDFPSEAELQIKEVEQTVDFGSYVFDGLYLSRTTTESWSCNGDSGGAIYVGSTIYAVHTAGSYNPYCLHGEGKEMWHTDLFRHKNWIEGVVTSQSSTTLSERQRAERGAGAHPSHAMKRQASSDRSASSPASNSTLSSSNYPATLSSVGTL